MTICGHADDLLNLDSFAVDDLGTRVKLLVKSPAVEIQQEHDPLGDPLGAQHLGLTAPAERENRQPGATK
jgi:hypothetical protein